MSSLKLNSSGGGSVTLTPASTASNLTATVPAVADTLAVQGQLGLRNKIINGAMMIDQRNAGASVTPTSGAYLTDRFSYWTSQASKFTAQQNAGSVTPPVGYTNYLGLTSASAYSIATGDVFYVSQFIEGLNCADLGWGTANAATVTLSFLVRSSLTGTFGGTIQNNAQNRSYPFIYTISSANTWEQKSVTITGDISGTWLTTNGIGIRVSFGLGVGSTYSGTAGSWSGSDFRSATGAVSVVGTNGATFYITGVQLEKGATATPFENRLYGTELALCQRYLPAFISESTLDAISNAVITTTTTAYVTLRHPVTSRTRPTGVTASASNIITVSGSAVTSAITFNNAGLDCSTLVLTSSGLTTGVAAATFLNTAGAKILLTGCEL